MCKINVLIYRKLILLIFFVSIPTVNLFSQGLNNDFPMDSIDIKNIINMLGIEMFKFPFQKQDDNCKLKIIMEIYENHKLSSKSVVSNSFPEEYLLMNEPNKTLRIYKKSVNDSTIGIRMDIGGASLFNQVGFDKDTLGMQQCRAYSDFQPVKGKSMPLFIWYSFGKGRKESMHCPGNSPLKTVAELYDFVIAISVEIEEIKK